MFGPIALTDVCRVLLWLGLTEDGFWFNSTAFCSRETVLSG